jgi:hypothetical protein
MVQLMEASTIQTFLVFWHAKLNCFLLRFKPPTEASVLLVLPCSCIPRKRKAVPSSSKHKVLDEGRQMLRIWWVMICHEYSQLIQTVVITWERSSFEIQGNTWQFQLCCDLGGEC